MAHQLTFPWLPVRRRVRRGESAFAARPKGQADRRTRLSAPRLATAAVRIPDPRITPLPLQFVPIGPQIFVHEGARQVLERRLALAFRGPVQLAVTDNRRRMVTRTRTSSSLSVRLHMMFLGAPDRVLEGLVRYVVHGDRQASQLVGEFIDANSHRIRADRSVVGRLNTRGRVHDLYQILTDLSHSYFGGMVPDVLVTWGRRAKPKGRGRATIKLGSYSAQERLIRIHRCLDNEWVPRYFVSYILYHELVHHVVPAVRMNGRASLHPPEFVRREREFRHYERALQWEKKHIDRLLRAR